MIKATVLSKYNLPKAGHTDEECEDAYSTKKTSKSLKVFVADGATESSFAKEWAKLLVDNLKKEKGFSKYKVISYLPKIRKEWKAQVGKKPLPWYAEMKLEKGAYSTIVGLWIRIKYKKSFFNCFAVGDSCIFHLRDDKILTSFPIKKEIEFSNNPFLVSTKKNDDDKLVEHFQELKNQRIVKGDYLFVMSDALACWFLNKANTNDKPWNILIGFTEDSSDNSFEEWLKTKREKKEIKNDDTTLLTIEIS